MSENPKSPPLCPLHDQPMIWKATSGATGQFIETFRCFANPCGIEIDRPIQSSHNKPQQPSSP